MLDDKHQGLSVHAPYKLPVLFYGPDEDDDKMDKISLRLPLVKHPK